MNQASKSFLFLIFFLIAFFFPSAQKNEEDSTIVRRAITPSIYIDYGKLITVPFNNETKYEGGIEVLFKEKIPLIVEVGSATLSPDKVYSNGSYKAEGQYLRFGTGIYSKWTPKNIFGITARYAISTFDEEATLSTESPTNLERTLTASFHRKGLSGSWMELVLYTDTKINDLLSVGLNLRYRYLLNYDLQSPDDVYTIPGYGRSFDNSIPAANLFLKVSF